MISIEDFTKLEIKIGKVKNATKVEDTDKLLKLIINFGDEERQIITGMAEFFPPEHFIGKEIPVLLNLEPRKFKGLESQGMILAADIDGRPILLHPEEEVPPGTIIK